MPEHFAFYSATLATLPEANMKSLAGSAEFSVAEQADGGRQFIYRWPNVQITCSEMPADQLAEHLEGFAGWVRRIYQGQPDARGGTILDRLRATRLVVGVAVEPLRDEHGLAAGVVRALSSGLDALMLFDSALFDAHARLLLAPDGSFDADAKLGNTTPSEADSVPAYQPTPAQQDRHARVLAQLQARRVPALAYALYVDDDERVCLRTPAEVARRVLVLSAVTLLAEGGTRDTALRLIDERQLWPAVSPEERHFLEAATHDPELAQRFVWRLECLWVLLWALGDVDELPWPSEMCDMLRLIKLLEQRDNDPDFVAHARLRSKSEILDALQATLLLHWAIRDAWVHRRALPENLDWSSNVPLVSIQECPAAGIVAERHQTLNWLTGFGQADWDDVDTPT